MFIRKIYLSWRPAPGERRFIIGILRRNYAEGLRFEYIEEAVKLARKEGFIFYPGLPDTSKKYSASDGIEYLFANRIIDLSRPDSHRYLSFWEATNPKYDYFDLLALTQGWIPTDNFEFLGDFYPQTGFTFITDLANVKARDLLKEDVEGYDSFNYRKEPNNNFDNNAIIISNPRGRDLGYIKRIHNNFFNKLKGYSIRIELKSSKANGIVKEIFVKISVG